MDLNQKLEVLSTPSQSTVTLKDLVNQGSLSITGSRRVLTRFGTNAVVLDIITESAAMASVFLPHRFNDLLSDADLNQLVKDGYKIDVTLDKNSTPIVNIFK